MLRIIALLCVLLIVGVQLMKDSPAGSNPSQTSNPTRIDADYKATHRNAEEVLAMVVENRKQRTVQTSVDAAATQPQRSAEGYAYTAKIQDGKVYLWLANNSDPQCHIGPFEKKSNTDYKLITAGRGTESLWKDSGRWFYIDNHVQMSPCTVDGSVLEK